MQVALPQVVPLICFRLLMVVLLLLPLSEIRYAPTAGTDVEIVGATMGLLYVLIVSLH